jgi:hypothetical protein
VRYDEYLQGEADSRLPSVLMAAFRDSGEIKATAAVVHATLHKEFHYACR